MTPPTQPSTPRDPGEAAPDGADQTPDDSDQAPDGSDRASAPGRKQSGAAASGTVFRRPLIVAAGCGALIVLLLLSVGGVFAVRALLGPDDQQTTQGQEEPGTQEDGGADADADGNADAHDGTDADADDQTAETGGEAAEDPEGEHPNSPSDVHPQGTTIEHSGESVDGTVEVSIDEVDWEATERVQELDQLVEQPPADQKYIMVDAELTYHGSEEFTPLAWASISFVGPDGTVYPDAGMATPSDAEQETSTDGQSQTQQWVFLVPEDLPDSGHFVIGDFGPVEEGQWIEAV